MSQHTPGPWFVDGDVVCHGGTYANGHKWVEQVFGFDRDLDSEYVPPSKPDLHLIAAAPDLLAACEVAIEHLDPFIDDHFHQLRTAIKKARGEI